MTLDEAITINTSLLDGTYDHRDESMEAALKLGIEAMKILRTMKEAGLVPEDSLLPGETKPEETE